MSRISLRIAQIVGVLVLAGLAIGIVVGLVQWLIGVVVIVALVAGAWWLFKKVSGRDAKPAVGSSGFDDRSECCFRTISIEPR